MINNHNYYKALEAEDLIELLANATDKYTQAQAIGLAERVLESYRELIDILQQQIQVRTAAKTDTPPIVRINTSPLNT
jgi:biotin-(acetyl-CoA carboxylase) ligase